MCLLRGTTYPLLKAAHRKGEMRMNGFVFEPVLPLDMLILDFLPPEGSTFAGIYPIGETVKAMVNKIGGGKVGTGTFVARVRLMHKAGLIVNVNQPGVGRENTGRAWQITAKGKAQLAEWKGTPDEQQ